MSMDVSQLLDGVTERAWTETVVDPDPIRVATVGYGWWTAEYALPAMVDLEACTPTVVVSGTPEKRDRAVEKWDTVDRALGYDAFADGVAANAYDAVYVCTPNGRHLPMVETAAGLGKAVLCEKPIEATPDRAERLVEACATAGVPLMMAYRMQVDPAVRRLRDLLAEGVVGDPVHVHGHMGQCLPDLFPDTDHWRYDPELTGPGVSMTDLGVYPLNTARFLLGRDPVAAAATARSESPAFASVPDEHLTARITYEGGIQASFSVSQNSAFDAELTVYGTAGTLRTTPPFFGADRQRVALKRDGNVTTVEYDPVDQVRELFAYFSDRVRSGASIEPSGRHALTDARAVAAVYEAVERDTEVAIDPA
jgi:xylose dehydrogenase (NAD/NADP)